MESSNAGSTSVKTILVPVDGSEHAKRAAQMAIELGSLYGADLIIISVVAPPAMYIAGPVGAPADLSEYYRLETEDANSAVNSAAAMAKEKGVSAKTEVLRPDKSVVETIVGYAEEQKADLIVIGTRGLGGFRKLLLGSVSSGVIGNAQCSVLVVR